VARELTVDELDKVARNLERIETYLVPRSRWSLPPAHRDTVALMRRSVDRLAKCIQPAAPADWEAPPQHERDLAALDPAALDVDQLNGFASYLERLDSWMKAGGAVPPRTGAAQLLARILSSLEAAGRALESIAGGPAPEVDRRASPAPTAASPPARPEQAAPTAEGLPAHPVAGAPIPGAPPRPLAGRPVGYSPAIDDVFAGMPRPRQPGVPVPIEQIALTSGDVDPMFRWIGPEEVELTPRARQRIEELFAAQGITFFRYQLENFAAEIRRRIRTAPEGHVLVIKVRDIGGERKPFLSYVPAKKVEGN
jgi:hypothetical protein